MCNTNFTDEARDEVQDKQISELWISLSSLLIHNRYVNIIRRTKQHKKGRAMYQAVSHRPVTAETRVSPRGICGRQSGSGTDFFLSFSFPCQYCAVWHHFSCRPVDACAPFPLFILPTACYLGSRWPSAGWFSSWIPYSDHLQISFLDFFVENFVSTVVIS
jgi:hypothetical protein